MVPPPRSAAADASRWVEFQPEPHGMEVAEGKAALMAAPRAIADVDIPSAASAKPPLCVKRCAITWPSVHGFFWMPQSADEKVTLPNLAVVSFA